MIRVTATALLGLMASSAGSAASECGGRAGRSAAGRAGRGTGLCALGTEPGWPGRDGPAAAGRSGSGRPCATSGPSSGRCWPTRCARFRLDRERVLVTGFSVWGSLAWYLAFQAPGEFAAFAPVAGSSGGRTQPIFAGPVRLLHTHGWRDQDRYPTRGATAALRAGAGRHLRGAAALAPGQWLHRGCARTNSRPMRRFGAGPGSVRIGRRTWSWCCTRAAVSCRQAGRRWYDLVRGGCAEPPAAPVADTGLSTR